MTPEPPQDDDKKEANSDSEYDEEDDEYQNQYTLIYPSHRNQESNYQKYLDHSQKCYEQFTGSYSKKKVEPKTPENDNKDRVNLKQTKSVQSPQKVFR